MAAITQARLKELLNYDPETGVFTWRVPRRGVRPNRNAGGVYPKGYAFVSVDGKQYYAHRLAWFYVHGAWPPHDIDHINRIRNDNRLVNLRLATRGQNLQNSSKKSFCSSSIKGVHWTARERRWVARIHVNYKTICLGYFRDLEAAITARKDAEKVYFTHGIC